MESFQDLISTIPDAKALLLPNETLSVSALKTLEDLVDDFNEFIMTQGFDEEQIWAQISLMTPKLIEKIETMKLVKDAKDESDLSVSGQDSQDVESGDDQKIDDSENEENDENLDQDSQDSRSQQSEEPDKNKDFFDVDEMQRFADEGQDKNSDPGLSVSEESDSQEGDMKYEEFYRDEEPSEEEPEKLFSYIDEREMNKIEEKMLADKPWQLKGEVSSKSRPRDSLLNEDLDFDVARKPVPQTQTKAVTDEIEDIIKQRVLDMLYDDVRPKKPLEPVKTRTAAEDFMDYEKSKKSLAELYEEDFKKEVLHIPVNTETERAKKEITVVFKKLCYNLDLLSSLNPVPRPVVQNLQVKNSQVPALVLEEVLPHAVSQKDLQTPGQVFDKKKAELKSEEELTKTDRNAARKRHKTTLRTRRKERILKVMNKIAQDPKAQKFEYRRMIKEEKARKELVDRKKQTKTKFTRSSEFFKNFQKLSQEIAEKEKKKDKEMPLSKKIKL